MNDRRCDHDGGPAFPVQESVISQGGDGVPAAPGMSLRDYFAAKAMQGLIESGQMHSLGSDLMEEGKTPAESINEAYAWIARMAYAQADAMLAARRNTGSPQELAA